MIFDATVNGRVFRVEVKTNNDTYTVTIDGSGQDVDYREAGPNHGSLLIGARSFEVALERQGATYAVHFPTATIEVELTEAASGAAREIRRASGPASLKAPMPGKIVRLLVGAGQQVRAGQGIVVMEAMKMENELRCSRAGTVQELAVQEGQAVETGALLAVIG